MHFKGSLQPIILQICGLLLLAAFVIIWVVTGDQSPLLVGASLTLVAVGSGTSAIITVRQEINVKDEDRKRTTTIADKKDGASSEA